MTTISDTEPFKLRDEACESLIATLQQEIGQEPEGLQDFVRDLFGKYFDASQKKREPADVAARKIAKIIAKQARRKFVPPPAPESQPDSDEPAQSGGRVTGKLSGIDRKIVNILNEISEYYGTPLAAASATRTKQAQANAMYTNWQSHLRNGKDNAYLAGNEKLRLQLDTLKQEKDKPGFVALLTKKADWSVLTRHLHGTEVDLAAATAPNVIAAIATCLNHRTGRNSEGTRCHHFDLSKSVWPITDSLRARWKKE